MTETPPEPPKPPETEPYPYPVSDEEAAEIRRRNEADSQGGVHPAGVRNKKARKRTAKKAES